MQNDTSTNWMNRISDRPVIHIESLESNSKAFINILCVLAIISNTLTIVGLQRMKKRSSTDKFLLELTATELMLQILFLGCHIYPLLNKDWRLQGLIFFMWLIHYNCTIMLTLTLAVRQFVAIEYPYTYLLGRRPHFARNLVLAIFLFCTFVSVFSSYKQETMNGPSAFCNFGWTNEKFYSVIPPGLTYEHISSHSFCSSVANWLYTQPVRWLYVFVFQIMSPLILAGLSFKFGAVLRRKSFSTPKQTLKNNKTKMILLVSLIIVVRDLPCGLIALSHYFTKGHTSCLTTLQPWTKELTVLMSALNFVVLYATHAKFKKAVPWPALFSRKDASPGASDGNGTLHTAPSVSFTRDVESTV